MSISMEGVFYFVFFYPLFMAFFWMIGAVIFFFRHERDAQRPPVLSEYPFVSVVVPCHNEGREIEDTIRKLETNAWPDYEIIAVNDGSSDDTGKILDRLAQRVSGFESCISSGISARPWHCEPVPTWRAAST